jgi:hypothetical protein
MNSLKTAYNLAYGDKLAEKARKDGYNQALREIKKGAVTPTAMKGGRPGVPASKPRSTGDPVKDAAEMYRTR